MNPLGRNQFVFLLTKLRYEKQRVESEIRKHYETNLFKINGQHLDLTHQEVCNGMSEGGGGLADYSAKPARYSLGETGSDVMEKRFCVIQLLCLNWD